MEPHPNLYDQRGGSCKPQQIALHGLIEAFIAAAAPIFLLPFLHKHLRTGPRPRLLN